MVPNCSDPTHENNENKETKETEAARNTATREDHENNVGLHILDPLILGSRVGSTILDQCIWVWVWST